MIAQHLACRARKVACEATRGYASGRGSGRKPPPEVFNHSARAGEAAGAQTRPTGETQPTVPSAAEAVAVPPVTTPSVSSTPVTVTPPSSMNAAASESAASGSSPLSASSPGASMASPGASIATSGATLQNPPGTPLPPPRKAGNGAFVAALLAGAGAGACYVYDAQNKTASTVTPVRSVTPETQTEETRAGETKGDPPKATPAEAPAPGRALNLRRLFAFEKQRERVAKDIGALATEKVAVTKVVTERSVTPETQTPKREETPTDPTPTPTPTPTPVAFKKVKEVTQEVPPEANEKVSLVFGTAADALLAVADAAAEAERIEVANEKERRASFAASETSSRDLNLDSNSAGPASATRAISLQTVSTNASAIHSNARSRQTATETDERLAPSATSSRGAAEDIARASAAFRATPLAGESDAVAFAKTLDTFAGAGLSQSPRSAFAIAHTRRTYTTEDARAERRALEVRLTESHAVAAELASTQIQSLANEIERSEKRVASLAAALSFAGSEAERLADETAAETVAVLKQSLETQALELKKAASACLIRERVARAGQLDEVRVRVGALTETLAVNSVNLKMSHKQLRVALATNALSDAASRGCSLDRQVAVLKLAAEGDDLVQAVVCTIPTRGTGTGTPTKEALTSRLDDVARAARRLALVPRNDDGTNGSGGVLTYVVSHVASLLRMRESAFRGDTGNGVEAALAVAAAAVGDGEIAAAASALENGAAGSAAATACAGWVTDARERQRLEMALTVLRAHLAVETATLA